MNPLAHKQRNRQLRKNRVRAIVSGTAKRPRLSVFISNRHITAQLIDDTAGRTLAYATSVGQKKTVGTMTERAALIGTSIAAKAKAKKINRVVFDRSSRKYHGRVKELADAARKAGLEF